MPAGAFFIFDSLQHTHFADGTAEMWVYNRVRALDRRALLLPTNNISTLAPALQAGSTASRDELFSVSINPEVILTFITCGTTLSFALSWMTAAWCGT